MFIRSTDLDAVYVNYWTAAIHHYLSLLHQNYVGSVMSHWHANFVLADPSHIVRMTSQQR